jgi:hypothetical protein
MHFPRSLFEISREKKPLIFDADVLAISRFAKKEVRKSGANFGFFLIRTPIFYCIFIFYVKFIVLLKIENRIEYTLFILLG